MPKPAKVSLKGLNKLLHLLFRVSTTLVALQACFVQQSHKAICLQSNAVTKPSLDESESITDVEFCCLTGIRAELLRDL